ncbi:MAG: sensor histidine kinase [Paracoccaceae bacterium]
MPKAATIDPAIVLQGLESVSSEAVSVYHSVRGEDGAIQDFRFAYVSPLAAKILQREASELIGKSFLSELPGTQDEGIFEAYCKVADSGQPWSHQTRYDRDGVSGFFQINAAKLDDGLIVAGQDIPSNRSAEDRLQQILDVVAAFVGLMDTDGLLWEANDFSLKAAGLTRADVVGKPFWDCYWWSYDADVQARLKDAVQRARCGETVRYDEVIRIANDTYMSIDFQLAPLKNPKGAVVSLVPSAVDIEARRQTEAHRDILVQELKHRVKNSFANIQAMANNTMRTQPGSESFARAFLGRLHAISTGYDLLMRDDDQSANLRALIEQQVTPYFGAEMAQIVLKGPHLRIQGRNANNLTLVFHELTTNSAKYGALSVETGTVEVTWGVQHNAGKVMMTLSWVEKDGPPVTPPARTGFGTILLEHSLIHTLDAQTKISYEPTGLVFNLTLDLTA